MRTSSRFSGTGLTILAAMIGLTGHAHAQADIAAVAEPAVDASAATGDDTGGEILVTARRREETLQDVPTAITAIGSAALESKAVNDIRALDGFIPNVNIQAGTTSASAAQIFLRGVGIDNTGFNTDPNVGIYMDDVFIGRLIGSLVGALDLERIEVLRGPQGTLYGRNSTAGAIKYVTRKPDVNDARAKASITLGTDDRRDFKGSVNVPLIPGRLALLLSGQTRDQDGYITLVDATGKDTGLKGNSIHAQDVRAALRFLPNDDVTVDIAADYTRNRSDQQSLTPTNCAALGTRPGLVVNPAFVTGAPAGTPQYITGNVSAGQFERCPLFYNDPYTSFVGPFAYDEARFDSAGASATVQWDADFGTLKYVSSYRGFRDIFASPLFGKPPPQVQVNLRNRLSQRQIQQEVQLSSANNPVFNYIVGLFYYRERITSLYQNQTGSLATVPYRNNDVQISNSYAGFGEVYITPIERLEVTIGGRYSIDRRTVDRELLITPPYTTPLATFNGKISSEKFTPKLGVRYDTGPVMVFATYTEGYRSPGYAQTSPRNPADLGLTVGIETETSYEAGFKANLFDRLLTINTSAFTSKYSNLQSVLTVAGNSIVVTADVRIKGVESEFTLRPSPGFTMFGNLGLLHGRYINPPQGQPYAHRLKHAPAVNFLIGANYESAMGEVPGTFFMGADLQHTGRAYRNVANTIDQQSDAYDMVSARVGYRGVDDRWSITAGATNLLDKVYYLLGTQNAARSYQPGRRFYVTGEVNF